MTPLSSPVPNRQYRPIVGLNPRGGQEPWRLGDSPRRGGRAGAVAFLVNHLLGKTSICPNKPWHTDPVGPSTMRTARNGQPTESACQTGPSHLQGGPTLGNPPLSPVAVATGPGSRTRRGEPAVVARTGPSPRPGTGQAASRGRSHTAAAGPGTAGAAPARPRSPSATGVGIPLVRAHPGLAAGVGHASTVRPDPSTLGVVGERGSRREGRSSDRLKPSESGSTQSVFEVTRSDLLTIC